MIANTARTWVVTGALALGAVVGAAGIANAATGSSGSTNQATPTFAANGPSGPPPRGAGNPAHDEPRAGRDAAERLGRVQCESGGACRRARRQGDPRRDRLGRGGLRAHLQKSDGSYVTVKLDRSFHVTATQSGFGGGPAR